MKRSHLIIWIPGILYYLFITAVSHVPGDMVGSLVTAPFEHFDKVVHFVMYTLLGIVVARALSWEEHYYHLRKKWYLYFLLIMAVAAFVDEIHQHFVPFRSMDFFDGLADVCGSALGGYIYFYILHGIKNTAKRLDDTAFLERDIRGMGLVLAVFYFVILVSLNMADYRVGILRLYPRFALLLTLMEYSLLGFLTIRFFYLRKNVKFFHLKDWLMLILFGAVFVGFHQLSFYIFSKPLLLPKEIFWGLLSFTWGAIFYYFDKQIDKFRKKILKDPLYKRKTWQRIYFFSPLLIIILLYTFISSQSSGALYGSYIPFPHHFVPKMGVFSVFRNYFFLHVMQFFVLGLFYFRAIVWESWWHGIFGKRTLWIVSGLLFVVFAFLDEYHQHFVRGRVGDITDSLMNVLGGALALVLYLYGYRVMKERYFIRKKFLGFPI